MSSLVVASSFLQQARESKSVAELYELLEAATKEIGFRYFALVDHVDLRRTSAHTIHLENYPESWARHFVENGLYAEDPIHRACLTTNVGFTWEEVPRKIAITSRQRAILENAAKHGLGDGFTVPANIPGWSSGSCSFATRRGQPFPEENLLLAQLIGGFAFQAARNLSQIGSAQSQTLPRLTPRQRECLLLAIQGMSDWNIGQVLDLSPETVNQHFDMARRRFHVGTRLQLALCAIFDGQISFIEALSWLFPWLGE